MSAQYGNSAGSVTNLVTKSGTNEYHGSGWWFNRNDWFDANTFFGNQSGTPRQALRFNQWGGTFGGPIVKDKLFFFLSYQQSHFARSAPPTVVNDESPEWRQAVMTRCRTPLQPCCMGISRPQFSALRSPQTPNRSLLWMLTQEGTIQTGSAQTVKMRSFRLELLL
jgi:hypothetical protein